MKVGIIGSRSIDFVNIEKYLPENVTEIVSGGAKGIDTCAAEYAKNNDITLTEFLPEYNKYKKFAPLKRNSEIVEYCDYVLAFWDGKSKGTKFVIDTCRKTNTKISVIIIAPEMP